MPSQRLIQPFRFLLQRALLVFRQRSWIYLFLWPFSSLHQKLFRGRPRQSTQSDGSQQEPRRSTTPRSFARTGRDGVVLTSCIPSSIGSTSGNLEPPSCTNTSYGVEHVDSHQNSPRSSVSSSSGPFNQQTTGSVRNSLDLAYHNLNGAHFLQKPVSPHVHLPTNTISLSEQTNHGMQGCHHHPSVTSLDVPANPTSGLRNLGPSHDLLRPSPSKHHLPDSPYTTNVSLPLRSSSAMSRRSGVSNTSARFYRRHEGATPRPRIPHSFNVPSAACSVISLAAHSTIAQPDSRLVALPGGADNSTGSPTFVAEQLEPLRLVPLTSHDVKRYLKKCFK